MKKIIFSALFLTAFSSGLLAKQVKHTANVTNVAIEGSVPQQNETTSENFEFCQNAIVTQEQINNEELSYCANTSFYYCTEAGELLYRSGNVCTSGSEDDWYTMIDNALATCD